jgi:hypothetical protein
MFAGSDGLCHGRRQRPTIGPTTAAAMQALLLLLVGLGLVVEVASVSVGPADVNAGVEDEDEDEDKGSVEVVREKFGVRRSYQRTRRSWTRLPSRDSI